MASKFSRGLQSASRYKCRSVLFKYPHSSCVVEWCPMLNVICQSLAAGMKVGSMRLVAPGLVCVSIATFCTGVASRDLLI
eukprot:6839302-Karenia_brevis.AAC.1